MFVRHRNSVIAAAIASVVAAASLAAPATTAQSQDADPAFVPLPENLLGFEALQGDAARGRQLFQSARLDCRACHSLERSGVGIGPSLFAVGERLTWRHIVGSVVDPSAEFAPGYKPLTVVLKDGQVLRGTESDADEFSVTLTGSDGEVIQVSRGDIEYLEVGRSPMPEGLVDHLTPHEFADLVAFLTRLRQPGPAATVSSDVAESR